MMRVLRLALALLAVLFTSASAQAQTGYVTGTVTDADGNGIGGATVVILTAAGASAGSVVTTSDGAYRISNVPAGTYTLRVRAISYRPAEQTITVAEGAPTMLGVQLQLNASVLNPEIISVQGEVQKATESIASAHAVQYEQINERPSVTVVDHVATIPGIDVVKGGIIQSNVVARGFNNIFSGTLLTLTDHRFAFVPSLRVNVPYLSPTTNEDIERIEVVLGPGSALYGPNASSGVMHVITRSPIDSKGTTFTLDAGNQSIFRGAVRHAGATVDERFGYKVSFEYFTGEDFFSEDQAEWSEGTQRDFDLEKYAGEVRLDFRPAAGTDIIATYGRAQAGSAIEPTGLGAAQIRDWVFNAYQLRASRGRLFGQVFLNQSDAGETFLLRNRTNPDGGVIVDKSTQLVGQLQHGTGLTSRMDFIYGLDYQLTTPQTEGTINGRNEDDDNVTEIGGYLHSRTQLLTNVELVAAIRVDKHSRLDDAVFSPRAGLLWQPSENQGFRVTYNRAFSTPSTNNLFLDLAVGSIPLGPTASYTVRTLGTPPEGFQFRRSCTGGVGNGLCMRSPFVPTSPFMPALASPLYQAAVAALVAGGLEAQLAAQIGGPGAAAVVNRLQTTSPGATDNVGTQLRRLNPTTQRFEDVQPADVTDLTAIEPTITNAYEVGYRGSLADRFGLSVDVWTQRRENFVGPLIVETPNVFLDRASLIPYLTTNLTPVVGAGPAAALAPVIATGMGGVPNATSTATTGVPLGVVNLDHPLNNPTDIVLAYRNFGTVDLWGSDLGVDYRFDGGISLAGTYSYVNKDFFARQVGGHDIALNAPASKGSVSARYRTPGGGGAMGAFTAELRNRWVAGFPANSGVYIGDVPAYSLLDAGFSFKPALFPQAMISVNATNLLDKEHIQFIGGAQIGRLIMTRLQYSF